MHKTIGSKIVVSIFYFLLISNLAFAIETNPDNDFVTPQRSVSRGLYKGVLAPLRLEDRDSPRGCSTPTDRTTSFRFRRRGNTARVVMNFVNAGRIVMTGRAKNNSWRAVRDTANNTYRLNGKRLSATSARVTHQQTVWFSGNAFCRWTWRGVATKQN
jgi:hypothetical protein